MYATIRKIRHARRFHQSLLGRRRICKFPASTSYGRGPYRLSSLSLFGSGATLASRNLECVKRFELGTVSSKSDRLRVALGSTRVGCCAHEPEKTCANRLGHAPLPTSWLGRTYSSA